MATDLEGSLSREMRVIIAKDVIVLIETQSKFEIDNVGYLRPRAELPATGSVTLESMPACEVCARGAMFLASVGRLNRCEWEEVDGDPGVRFLVQDRTVEEWGKQAYLIEDAFEGWSDDDVEDAISNRAMAFFDEYDDPAARLLAIMQNVIANDGEFIP